MAYGTVKTDTIIFDQGGADQNVTVSGIYRAITSGVTVSGTISGAVLVGTTTVSGATVTGTTVQGISGTFTTLTGTTTTGTTANFASGVFTTRVSGTTITGTTAQFTSGTFVSLTGTTITGTTISGTTVSSTTGTFTSLTGTTITGTTVNGTTVNSITGNFTTLTGTTTTGITVNFTSGVFTTQVSGATVTGTQSSFTSGNFVTLSGATATFTSGVIASGTAAAPSLSIISDLNTGIYSPGADQLAVATNGVGRLFVDASGNVGVATSSPSTIFRTTINGNGSSIVGGLSLRNNGTEYLTIGNASASSNTDVDIWHTQNGYLRFATNNTERLRITSAGLVGIGTSAPGSLLTLRQSVSASSDAAPTLIKLENGSDGGAAIEFLNDVAGKAKIALGVEGTGGATDDTFIGFSTSLNTTLSEKLRITSSGSVGIGTASPLTKLEVRSGVITAGSVDAPNGAEILRGYYGSSGALAVIGSEYSSGGIVIGSSVKPSTTTTDAFLSSASGALPRGAYTIAGNIHKWYIGGIQTVAENSSVTMSEAMRIDSIGRVGIGTSSPARVLDIAGTYANFGINGTSNSYIDYLINGVGIGIIGDANWLFSGGSTSNLGIRATNNLLFGIGAAERLRIDSSGRLLVGTSTARTNIDYALGTTGSQLQIEQAHATTNFSIVQNFDSATIGAPATFTLARSGATSLGSTTIVANNNRVGEINFSGSDGTDFTVAACIRGEVDGTPGANDMPGRLVFSTTADGASAPTERMRITSSGNIITTGTFVDPAITVTILEDIYTITDGAAFEVDPGNGSIQLITLGASRTPKATNFTAGESITLMVNDGTAYALTWTDATWGTGGVIWKGGTAPTLATTGYSVIQFWKVGTQVYGASVGDVA